MLGEQYEMETEGQEGVGRGSVWCWQGVWVLFSGQLELAYWLETHVLQKNRPTMA